MLSSFTEERAKEVYKQLVKLQFDHDAWDAGKVALEPFELVTGKRTYDNMVITEISVRTDHTSEYALMIEVHMQEVCIVETSAPRSRAGQSGGAGEDRSPADQVRQAAKPTPEPDLLGVTANKRHGIGCRSQSRHRMMPHYYEIPLSGAPQRFCVTVPIESGNNALTSYVMTFQYRDADPAMAGGCGWTIDSPIRRHTDPVRHAAGHRRRSTGAVRLPRSRRPSGGAFRGYPDAIPTFDNLGSGSHLYWVTLP